MSEYSLTTGESALWLAVKSRKISAKLCVLDWNSFLRENRRTPVTDSALRRGTQRSNTHIFGKIQCISMRGKTLYSQTALRKFLDELKHNPSRLEYLLKRVER